MRKYLIDFALIFMGIAFVAQSHEHQIQVMNQGTASLLDGQRHALLHAAELDAAGVQSAFPAAFVDEARLFKAEFASEIDAFNKLQAVRDNASAKQAMENFTAWRDSRVGNHWVVAESRMTQEEIVWLERSTKAELAHMRSTNPPKHAVASLGGQYPPNNGNSTGCGPDVSCNIAYSLGLADSPTSNPVVQEKSYQPRYTTYYYLEMDQTQYYNPILDGGTTMNCPPACNGNPVHTPNVSLYYYPQTPNGSGTTYTAYGNGVCGNCYQYASGTWGFGTNWTTAGAPGGGGPSSIEISDGGAIVCTVAGTFLNSGKNPWLWEEAMTLMHIHNTTPFSTTSGTWIYPESSNSPYHSVSMGYYTEDNYCNGDQLTPPSGHDADMSSYLAAMPTVYTTGGTLLASNCGGSGLPGCPVVPQAGLYSLASTLLWRFPYSTTWLVADCCWLSQNIFPNYIWEEYAHFWGSIPASITPHRASCTYSGANPDGSPKYTPARPVNAEQTIP